MCDERMATATFTTEQGELRCRFVNVDFDVHATWSSLGLAVVAGHPGYTTTRSIGLTVYDSPLGARGSSGAHLPRVPLWQGLVS